MTETWMPVSGTFRIYPLDVIRVELGDGPVYYSRGHHDAAAFLAAAVQEWAEYDYDLLTIYENGGWEDAEGPIWPPAWLRDPANVKQEWWATRQGYGMTGPGGEYSFLYDRVDPWRRGAYPVTVVEL